MPVNPDQGRYSFGLLPEAERSPLSFITSAVVNCTIMGVMIYVGLTAKKVIDQHKYQETLLILPAKQPPPPPKVKMPPPPPPEERPRLEVKLEAPKINLPKPEPKPDLKPIQVEAKVVIPAFKVEKLNVIEAPQPKPAMAAAMPAQDNTVKPSTKPVHYGQTFGVIPNPNAKGPATVAAIGNEYGGNRGPAIAPHGVVGSTGIGNGTKFGSNSGTVGRVASAGIPGAAKAAPASYDNAKVAAAVAPTVVATTPAPTAVVAPVFTDLEVLSKPSVQYTSEAKQLRVQGDVVLKVTFTANGQVVVQGVVHGLGHGLDEEARRVAQLIRFRPATRNGQPVDKTTNITISFQLA